MIFKHFFDWFCLQGRGYQFWSGIGSGSPLLAVIVVFFKHHVCYVESCYRLGHPHPDHDHRPVCRRHVNAKRD